ncbi:MAG: hypothetical protein N3A68_08485 [Bacteroidia bacterium]|jgi:hypothetical protein|nr:hypothetical protein [Bacteroidia bacterium]GIV22392.1 MAG: hypothetical protein KatS3mg025_0051 [Bacteroidia bacterium]
MESLLPSLYHWPLTPPLERLVRGKGPLAVFLPASEHNPETYALLEKILAAVKLSPQQASVWGVHSPVSLYRLELFSERLLWVFGEVGLSLQIGTYLLEGGQARPVQVRGWPGQQVLFQLPSLSQMLTDEARKREAWRWLKPLSSPS